MTIAKIHGSRLAELLKACLPHDTYTLVESSKFTPVQASNLLAMIVHRCQAEVGITPNEFKAMCMRYGIRITGVYESVRSLPAYDIGIELGTDHEIARRLYASAHARLFSSAEFVAEVQAYAQICGSDGRALVEHAEILAQQELEQV